LLDVWRFDLGPEPPALEEFLRCFWVAGRAVADSRLARLRFAIGRVLGWDDHDFTLPVPGCRETSLTGRLTAEDRRANRATSEDAPPLEAPEIRIVYRFENDVLYEASNDTFHILLHLGLISDPGQHWASLAVHVKSRGMLSGIYLLLITPFRHLIVYPGLVRSVERSWREAHPNSTG